MSEPFFIVGAPRSGTTLLRNLLRRHPCLECPEETSFYRWNDPFGTRAYTRVYRRDKIVCEHRKCDGFTDDEFWEIYGKAETRRQFQDIYMERFLEKRGNPSGQWFEKTPQNTAGLLRLLNDYPEARIVHLYRSPLNVVASIRGGNTVGPQSLLGAANVWLEAVQAALLAARQWPERILQIPYETLTVSPERVVAELLEFAGVGPFGSFPDEPPVLGMNLRYLERLTPEEIDEVLRLCRKTMGDLGYPAERAAHEAYLRERDSQSRGRQPATLKKKLARLRRRLAPAGEHRNGPVAE